MTTTLSRWSWPSTTTTTGSSSSGGTPSTPPLWTSTAGSGQDHLPALLAGSDIEIASSWVPSMPDEGPPQDVPMDLGSPAGGTDRLVQLLFVGGDTEAALGAVRAYADQVEAAGLAVLGLAAPFLRTVVGTDTYVDQL